MKQLNLIPQKIKKRQRMHGQNMAALAAVLVGLFALASGYVYLMGEVSQAQADLTVAQNHLDTVERQSGQGIPADPAAVDASVRITELNLLSAQDIDWNIALGTVASLVNPGLNLTTVTAGLSGSILTVTQNGTSPSNAQFASFADAMAARTTITGFKVVSYTFVPSNGSVSFSTSYALPAASLRFKTP